MSHGSPLLVLATVAVPGCWLSPAPPRRVARAARPRGRGRGRGRGAALTEARRTAPPAPPFVPGLERPEPIRMEDLEDVMMVTKDSNFEEAAEWIREGGRGIVVDHWRDFEICRKIMLKPLRQTPANAEDAERQRTLKKQLSDRLLGPVAFPGRIGLEGAPAAGFLQSLYGDLLDDEKDSAFALPSGILLGLVNAWQYFQGGLRYNFLAPPVLSGPIRPFYGVYAYPHPVTHFELLIEWLKNTTQSPRSALDLGTGCGVVSLILCRLFQVPEIIASDVSFNAVYGAQEELKRHHLQEVEVIQSDLFQGL